MDFWKRIREDFPALKEPGCYLDNASVAPAPDQVVQASLEFLKLQSRAGMAALNHGLNKIVPETQQNIANLIHANANEIALLENAGAGANIVANMLPWNAGDNIIITDLDFFPFQWTRLRKFGVEVRIARSLTPDGTRDITLENLQKLCDSKTRLIAVSWVSFINGLKLNLYDLGCLARELGAYLFVDAAQGVGAVPLDLSVTPVDFLTSAGYKWLLGPLGTAFFYCRKELISEFEPAYTGWLANKQTFNPNFCSDYDLPDTAARYMTGSLNLYGYQGLNAGVQYVSKIGVENIFARNRQLTDYFIAGAKKIGIRFMSPLRDDARSQVIGFIPNHPDRTIAALKKANISLPRRCEGLRFAPNFFNMEWEIDMLLEILRTVT